MGGRYHSDWHGNGVWRSLRDGDYDEHDVWDVLRQNSKANSMEQHAAPPYSLPYRNFPSAARMIPIGGGSSSSDNEAGAAKGLVQQSAPVNIPDWSKISGKKQQQWPRKSSKKPTNAWMGSDDDDDDDEDEECGDDVEDGDEGEEYGSSHMEPPHEMISRRMARTQISSFSVFEGVGRKLKGRDLSKVRNAILTRTGFLESP